jgi:hypothetical protein
MPLHRTCVRTFAHPRDVAAQVEPPCRSAVALSYSDTSREKLIARAAVEQRQISLAHWPGDGGLARHRSHLAVARRLEADLGGVRCRSRERTRQVAGPLGWAHPSSLCLRLGSRVSRLSGGDQTHHALVVLERVRHLTPVRLLALREAPLRVRFLRRR